MTVGPRLERILTSLWFRALFTIFCLAIHVRLATAMATERFGATGFNSSPTTAPEFANPKQDRDPLHWNRLAISRWDSGHYIGIALRGYTQCPQSSLRGQPLLPYLTTCDLAFYPGYSLIGRLATIGGRVPIDYALFGVSLVSSVIFMLLWTSRALTSRLGVGRTYLALVLFNSFTTGFTLVGIQTEPLFLALTLGAFICLDRRLYLVGALLAGAASGVRVSGVATGFAYGLALLIVTYRERPNGVAAWTKRVVALLAPAWGVAALFGFFKIRFDDALIYFHAHAAALYHEPGLSTDPVPLLRSMDRPLHEGAWTVLCILLMLVGRREAMRRFPLPAKTFWYAYLIAGLAISIVGTESLGLAGMTRYLLHALPIFFALAVTMSRRPLLLALWMAFSAWHYWQVDLCFYAGGPGNHTLQQCHDEHWIGDM